MRSWVDGNLACAWQTAYGEVLASHPETEARIHSWEKESPMGYGLHQFYEAYLWAVYSVGMKIELLESVWAELRNAARACDVQAIAAEKEAVRSELLALVKHKQKADAAIDTAVKLARRPQLWERMQRMSKDAVLDELAGFRGIGRESRYQIARNLGWDLPTHSGFTKALAENLRTDCNTLMTYLARAAGLRVSTTDIIMGLWSRLPLHGSAQKAVERFRGLIGLGG